MTTIRFPIPVLPDPVETPALVVDLELLRANIYRMAKEMAERGVALRPHAKTHKSLEVGRMQIAAGAVGLTCATLGEAEVFAEGGFEDLFVAYPVIATGAKAARLRALHERCRLGVGVDSAAGARLLGEAVRGSAGALRVLVEVDCGGHRTGVEPDDVVGLATEAARAGLDVSGVFTHGGHAYAGPDQVAGAAGDEVRALTEAAESLEQAGFDVRVVSAGSTPTAVHSARDRVTEERPGTYPFGDRWQANLGGCGPDQVALCVAATVVSVHPPDRFVIDAGAKALSSDVSHNAVGHGALPEYPDATVERLYDHHGVVTVAPGSALPEVGRVLAVIPNHVCPVVNLFDEYTVCAEGRHVATWPVDARGRQQ